MEKVDRIERRIVVAAPLERVWNAITEPGELSEWFGDVAEVELRPGGSARFGWTESDNVVDAVIELVEPPTRFAYRWATSAGESVHDGRSTRVEFTLEVDSEGTLVTVVESGFSALPDDIYESTLEGNRSGWRAELQDLADLLAVRQEA